MISLKYSYHATIFPHYNPGELGRNLQQKMLKDYNGQIYWLSLNIASFLPQTSQFPKWLNLSTGYGAEGMVGAVNNPKEIKGKLFLHLIDTASSILLLMLTSIALKVLLHLQVRFLNLIVL